MSNYPNMSYCMYENTCAALNQILGSLLEAADDATSLKDYRAMLSSRCEIDAFESIKELCEEVIAAMQDIDDEEDDRQNEFIVLDDEMIPVS
jgi:hypothetical protein